MSGPQAQHRWARMILECLPMAIRASKQAAYRGLDEPRVEQAMATIYPAQQANIDSQDYVRSARTAVRFA